MSNLFYGNFLFDLALGGYRTAHLSRTVAEMGTLPIPLASAGDRIILDCIVPDSYGEYLSLTGLSYPKPHVPEDLSAPLSGVAWGWDEDAVHRLSRAGATCVHPDLSTVKRVNSRKFCFDFNRDANCGVPGACECLSVNEVERAVRNAGQFPLVIKPEHGNAGYGFVRKTSAGFTSAELRQLDAHLQNNNRLFVEPWLNRVADLSSRCMIGTNGSITDMQHYRTCVNHAGAFYAIWIDRDDPVITTWRDLLNRTVFDCARKLAETGYFGPAGFDSLIWRDTTGKEHCAAIIEINARYSMSWIAFALHTRYAQDGVSLLHFIIKKHLRLPETYSLLMEMLGSDLYNPTTRKGVILTTPLRLGFDSLNLQQPRQNVFFLSAANSQQLFELDARVRKRFSPQKK